MSGTQDSNFDAKNSPLEIIQPGAEKNEAQNEQKLTPSQKMDMLLRGTSQNSMKKEIEKLRKESAKYRNVSKSEAEQRAILEEKSKTIQQELDVLRENHRNLTIMRKLDQAGCIKSELVAKDIPSDCEDLDIFIESYKSENDFLFKERKQSLGGAFKPSVTKNLTPSQQMDAYIRAALGR